MIHDSEFGWGSAEDRGGLRVVSSAALVLVTGLWCVSTWLVGGLHPLPYLATRVKHVRHPAPGTPQISKGAQ
jgi:hypothetical protein